MALCLLSPQTHGLARASHTGRAGLVAAGNQQMRLADLSVAWAGFLPTIALFGESPVFRLRRMKFSSGEYGLLYCVRGTMSQIDIGEKSRVWENGMIG